MRDGPRMKFPVGLASDILGLSRRDVLSLPAVAALTAGLAALPSASWALPKKTLSFPHDAGSHNDFVTEWWYITGYAAGQNTGALKSAAFGFQVTFFRRRVARPPHTVPVAPIRRFGSRSATARSARYWWRRARGAFAPILENFPCCILHLLRRNSL